MNIIIGGAGSIDETIGKLSDHVRKQYQIEPRSLDVGKEIDGSSQRLQVGAGADSVALGYAENSEKNVAVALLGCLNEPTPDFPDGSPMDSANKTASYILDRYLKLGDDFANGLIGQYAIVIQDAAKDRLVFVTDPTGIRTIFYTVDNKSLYFSTNMAILGSSCPDITINKDLEDFFLCYGYYPHQKTMFNEVKYLGPGAIATFEDGCFSVANVDHDDPWEEVTANLETIFSSEKNAINALYDAFMLATKQQLALDNKVAVLLGGADSALTASVLHRLGKEVETFSFYYEDSDFNQPHTDTLADFLGIKHHWIPITSEKISEGIERYPWTFNFPTNWPNYVIQTQILCDAIRERGFKHVYSGDGCDGTFLGYPRTHIFASFLDKSGHLSPSIVSFLTKTLNNNPTEFAAGRPYTLLLNSIRSMGRKMPERGYSTFRVMDENSVARLKKGNVDKIVERNEKILRELAAPLADLSMDRLAYSAKNALSPNRSKLAGSSDSTDVVINSPYLHTGMKRFAMSIPDKYLRPKDSNDGYNGKYLLFKMCEEKGLLPPEIIYQKKISAVDGPVDDWYLGQLQSQFREKLAGLPFETDKKYVEYLLKDKAMDKFYRRYISSDALTTHALALLMTYAQFATLVK